VAVYGSGVYDADTYAGLPVDQEVAPRYAVAVTVVVEVAPRYTARREAVVGVVPRYSTRHVVAVDVGARYGMQSVASVDVAPRYGTRQTVSAEYGPRYRSITTVSVDASPRYGTLQMAVVEVAPRYSTPLFASVDAAPRYAVRRTAEVLVAPAYRLLDAAYPSPVMPVPGAASDWSITIEARCGDTVLGVSRAVSAEVTLREGDAASWTVDVLDEDGTHHPENAEGAWHGVMSDNPYDANGDVVRSCSITAREFGQELCFVGLPTSYRYSQMRGNAPLEFTWSGVDRSHKLYREEQTMPTVRSRRGSTVSARSAIQGICDAYGVRLDATRLEDRAVPVQHRQAGKPIDWITELLEVGWETWRMDGDTLTVYFPTPKARAMADWTVDLSSALVEQLGGESNLTAGVSRVTCTRTIEATGRLAEVECYAFGQYSASWSAPAMGIRVRVKQAENGMFSDFLWYDRNGVMRAVTFPRGLGYGDDLLNGSVHGSKSVKFTWGASANVLAAGGAGTVQFIGHAGQSEDSLFGDLSEDVTWTATASSDTYSSDKTAFPRELPDNPLIPNSTWLQRHVDRYLERYGRKSRTRTMRMSHLVLGMRPGDTVREVFAKIHVDRAIYVTEVTHRFSDDPSERYTEYSGVEYVV
jgi:hypothetical protein